MSSLSRLELCLNIFKSVWKQIFLFVHALNYTFRQTNKNTFKTKTLVMVVNVYLKMQIYLIQ